MALKAGTVADFNASLAQAMEQAFQDEWNAVKGEPLPDAGEEERKILFAAVAQGMLEYLKANLDGSLVVDVAVSQDSGNQITSTGGSITVTQDAGGGNRVQSTGQSTNLELLTE